MCVLQKFHVPAVALERSRPKNKTKLAKEEMSPLHRRFLFVLSRDGTKELCHFSGRMTYVLVLKTIVKLWQQSCWRSRNTPATIPIFYGKETFTGLHGKWFRCGTLPELFEHVILIAAIILLLYCLQCYKNLNAK